MTLNCSTVSSTARRSFTGTAVAIAAVATLGFTAATSRSAEAFANASEAHGSSDARELKRLHAHFDSVLFELSQRDIATLSPTQLAHRSFILNTLASYNAAGVFPHNYDFAELTPYFIDRKTGHLCAFAFLLESTGRRDIVDRVANANNNVYVEQLAADTALTSWFNANGVTLAEGERIQVVYSQSSASASKIAAVAFTGVAGFVGSLGASGWNATGNRNGHSRGAQVFGLVAGSAAFGVGTVGAALTENDPKIRQASVVASAVGALSIGLAVRSIMHRARYADVASTDGTQGGGNKESVGATSFSPIIPLGKNSGMGVSMQIKF